MVEIYCDGADFAAMEKYAEDERIKGFTTNPSIMKKAGITRYEDFAKRVLEAVKGKPVSFEVLSDDHDTMLSQAERIASWSDNVYVKIPITDTAMVPTDNVVRELGSRGVKVNVTAIMTRSQLGNLHHSGTLEHDVPTILSIFAGRVADTGERPAPIFNWVRSYLKFRPSVKLLWASPRQVADVYEAEKCADIITLTPDLIEKLSLRGKHTGEYSLETVRMFHEDGKGIEW